MQAEPRSRALLDRLDAQAELFPLASHLPADMAVLRRFLTRMGAAVVRGGLVTQIFGLKRDRDVERLRGVSS